LALLAAGVLGAWAGAPRAASAQAAPAGARAAANPDEVVAVVRRLFEGMREADSIKARSVFAEGARFASVADRNGTQATRYTTVDGFVASIGRSGRRLDERIYDVQVHVDDNIAVVWAPYTFYQDGRVQHCGVDLIDFLRVGGEWKITQLADTRRTEGCRDVPPGPPER
jgi:hypothetical protein